MVLEDPSQPPTGIETGGALLKACHTSPVYSVVVVVRAVEGKRCDREVEEHRADPGRAG